MKKNNDINELEFGESEWDNEELESDKKEMVVIKTTSKEIHNVPTDWTGWNKLEKVQHLVEVIQAQIQKVRSNNFDLSKAEAVAALALEAQIDLAEYYAEAESYAKDAKNLVEYAEGEVSNRISFTVTNDGKKISEAALKRQSCIDDEVKSARKQLISLDKECRKWRYIFEMLKDAHIFFRNLGKV